jgi:hypothetical protein
LLSKQELLALVFVGLEADLMHFFVNEIDGDNLRLPLSFADENG